jgi:hypothetical protein
LLGLATPALAGVVGQQVRVEGTRFEIIQPDGSRVAQQDLVGAVVSFGDGSGMERRLRIDGVSPDPRDIAGGTMLYALSEQTGPSGEWENVCKPDPDGHRFAFPLAGSFAADGRYRHEDGRILITCTGGAEAKCIRFGYKPWDHLPDGRSLEPYYQACVRAVRADYCGDGVGHTRDGTLIDIFDHVGIEVDQSVPGIRFEAAFNPDGAVCVNETRLPHVFDRASLSATCPRLAAVTPCSDGADALIYVRSFGW